MPTDPHVYPDPQTAPLELVAATLAMGSIVPASSALIAIEELLGPDNTAEPGIPITSVPTTMFIRLAMSGAIPAVANQPTITLQANTGAEVEITTTYPSLKDIYDVPVVPGVTSVASAAKFAPDANNVYLIKVLVAVTGRTWRIRINNYDTASSRKFTWVVSSSLTSSRQPWIDVVTVPATVPVTLTYNALINQSLAKSLSIKNYGTGSFDVTGVSPALGAEFVLAALPITVAPNSSQNLTVTFNAPAIPTAQATTTTRITTSPTDSTALTSGQHNKEFKLQTTTQALEVTLLLDDSGSMGWLPNGTSVPTPPGELYAPNSRWSELVSAVRQFLELLAVFGQAKGKFGIAKFPGSNPADITTFDITLPTDIPNLPGMLVAKNAVTATVPANGTPMGDGISRVLANLGANSYFSLDGSPGQQINRRWLLLMSDGANNSGTNNPRSFILPPKGTAAPGTSLADKKIKVFSVGYGVIGHAEVDYELLKDLAAGSFEGGQTKQVDDDPITHLPTSATDLAIAFKSAIKSGLTSASSPSDPYGVLRPGAAEARYSVIITPYDTKVVFALNWNTPDRNRMSLQLLTPTCELITPESFEGEFGGGSEAGLSFSRDVRYQMYVVEQDYLQNRRNPSQPRYGTWRLIISSSEIAQSGNSEVPRITAVGATVAEDSESYAYDVLVESGLQLDVQLDRTTYFAGDQIGISAIITLDGQPIKNASVTVSLTAPGQSVNNWLAAIKISDEEYQRAAAALTGQDINPVFIKAYAARVKGITFTRTINPSTIVMTDPQNEGVYQATIAQTSTPENYAFYVVATGQTDDGVVFRREQQVQVRLGVRPDPQFTLINIQYLPLASNQQLLTAVVKVTPVDRYGNVLLLDPVADPSIVLAAQGGNLTPLTTKFDASYTSTLTHPVGTTPLISLQIAGQDIVTNRPAPAVGQSRYVDQVLDAQVGGEAAPGANRHRDPQAVLGNITTKPENQFLSLGAYGSVVVGIQGQIITAQSENDITVFIQPDEDLRPYLVEVLPVETETDWVSLGKSVGITQSFGLGKIGVKAAKAIRITDESGRTRGADLEPIATPGVSVRGVGVKRTALSSEASGCLEMLSGISLFRWLLHLLGLTS